MTASTTRPDLLPVGTNRLMFTLKEAAAELGVESKTVRKRMRDLGIMPVPDTADKRARLLTAAQVRQLANDLSPSHAQGRSRMQSMAFPATPAPSSSLEQLVLEIIRDRTRQLDERATDLDRRERVLDAKEAALTKQIRDLVELVQTTQTQRIPRMRYPLRRHVRDQSLRRPRHARPRPDNQPGGQDVALAKSPKIEYGKGRPDIPVHTESAR